MVDVRKNSESRDIKYVTRRLDEFYAEAVRNDYPYLTLDPADVPAPMIARANDNGQVAWRMLPSTITNQQINSLEAGMGYLLPPMYRAYLKSRFHLFEHLHPYEITDEWNGHRSGFISIATIPCNDPLWTFKNAAHPTTSEFNALFEHRLFQLGFIVIGWNISERFVLDSRFSDGEGDYEVAIICHSFENSVFDRTTNKPLPFDVQDISTFRYRLCSSFREFVDKFIKFPAMSI
jgi:hypothetical protein